MEKWIRLNGLHLDVSIGIHDFEKAGPQPYRLDIGLRLSEDYWAGQDAISETVDYDKLRNAVTNHLRSRHFNLQETVIQEIMVLCFELDERVIAADVKTAKTSVYPDCESVGLHYVASRQEWAYRKQTAC